MTVHVAFEVEWRLAFCRSCSKVMHRLLCHAGRYSDRLAWQFDVSRAQLRGKDWEGADGRAVPAAPKPSRTSTRG